MRYDEEMQLFLKQTGLQASDLVNKKEKKKRPTKASQAAAQQAAQQAAAQQAAQAAAQQQQENAQAQAQAQAAAVSTAMAHVVPNIRYVNNLIGTPKVGLPIQAGADQLQLPHFSQVWAGNIPGQEGITVPFMGQLPPGALNGPAANGDPMQIFQIQQHPVSAPNGQVEQQTQQPAASEASSTSRPPSAQPKDDEKAHTPQPILTWPWQQPAGEAGETQQYQQLVPVQLPMKADGTPHQITTQPDGTLQVPVPSWFWRVM